MDNKVIWMFREGRSGSGWASMALSKKLNRELYHFDKFNQYRSLTPESLSQTFHANKQQFSQTDQLYSTHFFFFMPLVTTIDNLYIIRTTRRNKIEQALSLLYMIMYPRGLRYYYTDMNLNRNINHFNKTLENPISIAKQDVLRCLNTMKNHDELWAEHSVNQDKFILVYEDCESGVDIPDLNVTMKWALDPEFTQKTPEYKTKAFVNYDQIVDWCNDYLANNTFTQY